MVHKRHVDDALGAYILLQVQDHNDKAKDVAEEVGVSLATIFRIKKGVQGLKREVVRLFVGKSHNKGVIRCDPYDKLDGPFFEKYVREQFPKHFLGKQTRMWYNRSKIVIEQITSGCEKPTSCL